MTKIPTTNLYVFLAVLGISLFAFSLVYPMADLKQYRATAAEIDRDVRLLDLDRNTEFARIVREIHDHPVASGHAVWSALEELRGADGEFTEKGLELEKRKIDIGYRRRAADAELDEIVSLEPAFKSLSVLGFILTAAGLWGWLVRVQRYQDLQLRNTALAGHGDGREIPPTLRRHDLKPGGRRGSLSHSLTARRGRRR
jgi:hypothetical protein